MTLPTVSIRMNIYRLNIFLISVLAGALSLAGCSSGSAMRSDQPSSSRSSAGKLFTDAQSDNYIIREGDKIELSVWDYPEFTTTTTVSANGMITLPLVGDIEAAGLTKEGFSVRTRQKLKEYVKGDPKLTISIASPTALKISVIGAVTRQDNYPVTSDVSLLEVLSTAGGSTTDSDLNHVRIIRAGGDDDPVDVNLAHAIETGKVETLPRVHPGDTVYIPKKENFVRSFSDFLRDAVLLFGFFRVLY